MSLHGGCAWVACYSRRESEAVFVLLMLFLFLHLHLHHYLVCHVRLSSFPVVPVVVVPVVISGKHGLVIDSGAIL